MPLYYNPYLLAEMPKYDRQDVLVMLVMCSSRLEGGKMGFVKDGASITNVFQGKLKHLQRRTNLFPLLVKMCKNAIMKNTLSLIFVMPSE